MLTQPQNNLVNMHPDFKRVLGLFQKRYGESIGTTKFMAFVSLNKLDIQKQYHPSAQFTESFGWVEPLISKYKQDNEAKYYLVRALTANVSMKNTDWSDYTKMQKAAVDKRLAEIGMSQEAYKTLRAGHKKLDCWIGD